METKTVTNAFSATGCGYIRAYSNVKKDGTKRIKLNGVSGNLCIPKAIQVMKELGAVEVKFKLRDRFCALTSVTGYFKVDDDAAKVVQVVRVPKVPKVREMTYNRLLHRTSLTNCEDGASEMMLNLLMRHPLYAKLNASPLKNWDNLVSRKIDQENADATLIHRLIVRFDKVTYALHEVNISTIEKLDNIDDFVYI